MDFLENVKARAKAANRAIVLPETDDIRTLQAAEILLKEQLVKVILVGSRREIFERAKDLDLTGAEIVDPALYSEMHDLTAKLYEARKAKGMTEDTARALLKTNTMYLGCMMVKEGLADGMVAGAQYSTAEVLRPALQVIKTAPGTKLVSSFFIMDVPSCEFGEGGTFLFSDCALVQNPTADELACIAVNAADSFKKLLGVEPKVAMLSHSTLGSANHADIDKVREAVQIAKKLAPQLALEGELQLDAAIVPEIAKIKAPVSAVAGHANVLIFPDLDAGNIGYKLVERLAKAVALGPITQGLAKPVNDLSRGCCANDIVGVSAITALLA